MNTFDVAHVFNLWFLGGTSLQHIAGTLKDISLELLVLFLLVSIGIYAFRAWEGLDIEGKLRDFLICGILILLWPLLVVEIYSFVGGLNVMIVDNVFKSRSFFESGVGGELTLQWILNNFTQSGGQPAGLSDLYEAFKSANLNLVVSGLGLLLNLLVKAAMLIIEVFYNAYFYLFTLLGPIVIARAIFSDHLEGFFELIREFLVVMFWPTTFVILVGISSLAIGNAQLSDNSFIKLSSDLNSQIVIVVLTLFVPSITNKFAAHLGASIVSPLLKFTGVALGLAGAESMVNALGSRVAGAGFQSLHFAHSAEKAVSLGEIVHEHSHVDHFKHVAHNLHHQLHESQAAHESEDHGEGEGDLHGAAHAEGHHDEHAARGEMFAWSSESRADHKSSESPTGESKHGH